MKKIKLGELCKPSVGQIKEDSDKLIDYIDISSVDNETKKVTGYQTIAFRDAPSRARKMVKRGSILVSTVRPNLNAVAMLEDDTPNITIASTGFCILDCKENANNRFIFNFCKSRAFIDDMVSQATGASYPAVSDKIVRSALVPDYSYEEQCKISEVLDRLSAVIDNRKTELSALDELIRARFVEMFGTPYENEKGFPLLTVDDVIEFTGGAQPDKKYFEYESTEENIRLIQIRDYKTDNYITYIPKSMAKRFCDADDIMIGRYGPPIFQILKGIEGAYNVALMKATPKMGNKEFIRYFLKQECLFKYLDNLSQRTAGQSGIEMSALKAYPFPYPPIELQEEFEKIAKQVDKSKDSVQKALDEAQLLFDSLMQQYFG